MNDCTCSCNYDGDSPELFSEKIVTARKKYRCFECGGIIKPGDKYEYVKGKWDGDFSSYKTCILCARIRDDLCQCGFIYGELRNQIWNDLGFDYLTGEEYIYR